MKHLADENETTAAWDHEGFPFNYILMIDKLKFPPLLMYVWTKEDIDEASAVRNSRSAVNHLSKRDFSLKISLSFSLNKHLHSVFHHFKRSLDIYSAQKLCFQE